MIYDININNNIGTTSTWYVDLQFEAFAARV